MVHLRQIRAVNRAASTWQVGCPCGWTFAKPFDGDRQGADAAWDEHVPCGGMVLRDIDARHQQATARKQRSVGNLMKPRDYRNG